MITHHRVRTIQAAFTALVALTALAACGDDSDSSEEAGGGDTGPATLEEIPEGTTLRFADQAGLVQMMLTEAGELEDVPYDLEFVDFMGGPPVNEAFAADEVDVALLVDTPAVQNQAADLGTVVIGATQYDGTGASLFATGDSGIETIDDLPGNEIAYTQASMYHGFVLLALDAVGADESDITPVDVPITDLAVTVGRETDVGVLPEYALPGFQDDNPDAVEVATYSDLIDMTQFLLATRSTVEDPARGAALEDFTARFARGTDWVTDNTGSFGQAYYIDSFGLDPEDADAVSAAFGRPTAVEITDELRESQQHLADLYHDAGTMPMEVDMSEQFDPEIMERFNAVLAESGSTSADATDDTSDADDPDDETGN